MSQKWVWGLAGSLALIAGIGLGTVHYRSRDLPTAQAVAALTSKQFGDLEGGKYTLSKWRGKVLVVNFWATWCAPCLYEIPNLMRAQARLGPAGLQIVGLALDSPENARSYAGQVKMNYPVVLAGMETIELARALGNRAGVLPYTVILDRAGRLLTTHVGILAEEDLDRVMADAAR